MKKLFEPAAPATGQQNEETEQPDVQKTDGPQTEPEKETVTEMETETDTETEKPKPQREKRGKTSGQKDRQEKESDRTGKTDKTTFDESLHDLEKLCDDDEEMTNLDQSEQSVKQ